MKMKTLMIAGALFFTGFSIAPIVPAQAAVATCPGDYFSFILTARSAATRKQTFSDFFNLGYCQLNDIMALEDELDTVRESFRDTANSCGDTSEYKAQYAEILMEEYFVRNIQKSKSDVINEVDEDRLKALKSAKLATLKKVMMDLFVNQEQRVNEDTFNTYFTDWSSKYEDRIANYAHCEEGSWAELQSTWQKFVDDINAINIDVKKDDAPIESQTDTDANEKEMSSFGQSFINAYEYVTAKKEEREAEVEAPTSVQELSTSGQSMSFQEALQTLKSSDTTFSIETNAADRMATYELLYGAGGAVAATDMQSVLVYMNQILMDTNTKDFPNITKSSEQVYGKQCQ